VCLSLSNAPLSLPPSLPPEVHICVWVWWSGEREGGGEGGRRRELKPTQRASETRDDGDDDDDDDNRQGKRGEIKQEKDKDHVCVPVWVCASVRL